MVMVKQNMNLEIAPACLSVRLGFSKTVNYRVNIKQITSSIP